MIAFDLDDTLCRAKSPMTEKMQGLFSELLNHYDVCVISGGKLEQFKLQVLNLLDLQPEQLHKLHLMPTCGTRYYLYDDASSDWALQYAEDLSEEQKTHIMNVLRESAMSLGLWAENPAGEIIEDRGSQVTMSTLGQQATAEDKYAWDPTGEKKLAIRNHAAPLLPEFEVRAAGTTSIDVTPKGIDKAHGMKKLIEAEDITKEDILFIGDRLDEAGNDYPVKAMGIDTIAVERWEDTALVIETLVKTI